MNEEEKEEENRPRNDTKILEISKEERPLNEEKKEEDKSPRDHETHEKTRN